MDVLQSRFQYSVKEIEGDSSDAAATEKRVREGDTRPGVATSINIGRAHNEQQKPPPV